MSIQFETTPHLFTKAKPNVAIFRADGAAVYVSDTGYGYGFDSYYNDRQKASYIEETFYINYTNQAVTFVKRDGLAVVVAHQSHPHKRGVMIVRCITMSGITLTQAIADLADVQRVNTMERQALAEAVKLYKESGYVDSLKFYLEYFIPTQDLHRFGDAVYHQQTDTVVSLKAKEFTPAHPYSSDFHDIGSFGNHYTYGNQTALNLRIRVFDHTPDAPVRFIRLAGKVFRLLPERSKSPHVAEVRDKKNGKVYKCIRDYMEVIYPCHADTEMYKGKGIETRRYTFEEAKEFLGITPILSLAQDTEHIAREHTERMLRTKREFEEMQQDHEKQRFSWSQINERNKQETIESSQKLEKLKAELTESALVSKHLQSEKDAARQELAASRAEIEQIQQHRARLQEKEHQIYSDALKHLEAKAKFESEAQKLQMQNSIEKQRWIMATITTLLGCVAMYYKVKASKA